MILTDEERARFCQYLEESIHSGTLILEQFKKLPFGVDQLVQKEKIELMASKVVLAKLRSIETQTINGR